MLNSQSHQCDGCKVRNNVSCFSFFWDFGVHFVTPTTTHISTKKKKNKNGIAVTNVRVTPLKYNSSPFFLMRNKQKQIIGIVL